MITIKAVTILKHLTKLDGDTYPTPEVEGFYVYEIPADKLLKVGHIIVELVHGSDKGVGFISENGNVYQDFLNDEQIEIEWYNITELIIFDD